MCGRYVAAKDPAALAVEFEIDELTTTQLRPDYNVAPTKPVYIVAERFMPDQDESDQGVRMLRVARWGLVPGWAKDPSIGARMINARSETAAQKPSFRSAVTKRRCLIPADGYYEWRAAVEPKGRKQPFYIHPADTASLAMAGLYEWWRDPTRDEADEDAWLLTCAVLTTSALGNLAEIHDRMPGTIAPADWDAWLDPQHRVDVTDFLERGWREQRFAVDAVSTAVNNVRNNGPELIAPIVSDAGQ
jgi:putative SOS response-associated peptidase YedK